PEAEELPLSRIDALLGKDTTVALPAAPLTIRNVAIVETAPAAEPGQPDSIVRMTITTPEPAPAIPANTNPLSPAALADLWDVEFRAARRKLEPDGALTGATRELQAGIGALLAACHEHGVKVGPWRLQHVVPELTFSEHPTYGALTLAHWACKDGQPWKVGIGLFLARGAGKPRDLETKLSIFNQKPALVDHLILLRPEDDLSLTGKSKTLWTEAERRGQHPRLEAATLDGLALAYSVPRWLAAVRESLPSGTPMPNLADLLQDKCERLLEQLCMPVS
ncbi:MAG: hypothetical protein ACRCZF_11845, partial [Gemmataceae bacterium]